MENIPLDLKINIQAALGQHLSPTLRDRKYLIGKKEMNLDSENSCQIKKKWRVQKLPAHD